MKDQTNHIGHTVHALLVGNDGGNWLFILFGATAFVVASSAGSPLRSIAWVVFAAVLALPHLLALVCGEPCGVHPPALGRATGRRLMLIGVAIVALCAVCRVLWPQ